MRTSWPHLSIRRSCPSCASALQSGSMHRSLRPLWTFELKLHAPLCSGSQSRALVGTNWFCHLPWRTSAFWGAIFGTQWPLERMPVAQIARRKREPLQELLWRLQVFWSSSWRSKSRINAATWAIPIRWRAVEQSMGCFSRGSCS